MRYLNVLLSLIVLVALSAFAGAADNLARAKNGDTAWLKTVGVPIGEPIKLAGDLRVVPVVLPAMPAYQREVPSPSWGAIYNYDLATKQSAIFAGYRLTPINAIGGNERLSASLWSVAGATIDDSARVGFAVTADLMVAENGWITAGVSWTKPFENQATRFGLVLGWRVEVRL